VFSGQWLSRPLPAMDPVTAAAIADEVRRERATILADLPATLRRILRKRLVVNRFSMDDIAAQLSMHRRTLDRRLQRCGTTYGELLQAVRVDVARQLLRDTELPIQRVAESVHFSSAANFATSFRRRTGMSPTEYRRRAT
jgi:AraC-like DNA-binding protein